MRTRVLCRLICGEILRKACAADPADRYPTARELAADLDRFLTDRPVQAREGSRLYKAAKLIQRNKVVAGLVAGPCSQLGLWDGHGCCFLARSRQRAPCGPPTHCLRLLRGVFGKLAPGTGEDVVHALRREFQARSPEVLVLVEGRESTDRGEIQRQFGSLLYGLGALEEATEFYSSALALAAEDQGPDSAEALCSQVRLARALEDLGRRPEAEALFRRASGRPRGRRRANRVGSGDLGGACRVFPSVGRVRSGACTSGRCVRLLERIAGKRSPRGPECPRQCCCHPREGRAIRRRAALVPGGVERAATCTGTRCCAESPISTGRSVDGAESDGGGACRF